MQMRKALSACALSATLLATGFTGAVAATADPYIIGGQESSSDWTVQLNFKTYGESGTFACTGEQLNSEWVLTARHCIDGSYNMQVFQSNDQINPGDPIKADQMLAAPHGDIALVHLSHEAPLNSYPTLNFAYDPKTGDSGVISGYGRGANSAYTYTLRKAAVSVIGTSFDAYGGNAVHLRGADGASNHGDSGGPFTVNGQVVAVCSTGDKADPGADIHAQSNYALLSQSEDWIISTSGITEANPAPETPVEPEVKPAADPVVAPVVDSNTDTNGWDWSSSDWSYDWSYEWSHEWSYTS